MKTDKSEDQLQEGSDAAQPTPNVDSIANIVREAFQLGKRVANNPDYYSLSDPLGDFLNENVYKPYGGIKK